VCKALGCKEVGKNVSKKERGKILGIQQTHIEDKYEKTNTKRSFFADVEEVCAVESRRRRPGFLVTISRRCRQ